MNDADGYFGGISWQVQGRSLSPAWIVRDFRDRYGITYIHTGTVLFSYDHGPARLLTAPVAWLTHPGHFGYGRRDGGRWDNRYLNFGGPRVQRFIDAGFFPLGQPPVPVVQSARFCAAFDELFDAVAHTRCGQERLVHMLEGLLLLLMEQRRLARPDSGVMEKISLRCRHITAHPAERYDLADEARMLGLSYPSYRRRFRMVTGDAPHQFILKARLALAADRLVRGTASVTRIAGECGFPDIFQFSRQFKNRYKVSPAAWREENRR
ncbi:MAG: helix-turn-helix transcriptional regulator [Spirochaetes bacterium]|nr:helix-turn-helix transcriptional regulator [Spirochaetota bacterium]